ncbi:metallophosphoesterase family protein [Celerinatantimonas yamalensis]|uniref:Metallophosphoesterase family protein n=1 Tax=Celerinatantimonas yamalensis TaxID=559956 RepID=A0ABW9G7L4_9GAMM
MRIAAIYDIHANSTALEAVIDEIKKRKVDRIVVGGDVVAGPSPLETLTLLRNITIPIDFILGNAESELLKHIAGKDVEELTETADEVTHWLAKQMTTEHKQFLSSWIPTLEIQTDTWGQVLFCHGSPRSNTEIFTRLTPGKKLASIFGHISTSMVVCGHTHMQFKITSGSISIINAGSVGMPYSRTGAEWLLLDDEIHFMHTDYDISKAAELIRKTNYPQAEEFVMNNVLNTPSEEEALEVFSQMERNQTVLEA